jgi:hypothetical protein
MGYTGSKSGEPHAPIKLAGLFQLLPLIDNASACIN